MGGVAAIRREHGGHEHGGHEHGGHEQAAREQQARELFAAHYPRLAGWCIRLVGDETAAHDIAAEAFTRLWARWRRVEDPRGYLYVVAANLVKDHWRHLERERRALARVGPAAAGAVVAEVDLGIRDAVEALPVRLRDVVLLHYYADIAVAEVAAALHLPEGTVKSRLSEARKLLLIALEGTR